VEVSGQLHVPAALPPGKESPVQGAGCYRTGIDIVECRQISCSCQKSNSNHPNPQPVAIPTDMARLQWDNLVKLIVDECDGMNKDTKFD
jgi:hypothetical protein